jgi:hypothetical protein
MSGDAESAEISNSSVLRDGFFTTVPTEPVIKRGGRGYEPMTEVEKVVGDLIGTILGLGIVVAFWWFFVR